MSEIERLPPSVETKVLLERDFPNWPDFRLHKD